MKVAKVIDQYRVAITKTDHPDVKIGEIVCVGTELITDPETGEDIGVLAGIRLKVAEVYEKFFIAETYKLISPDGPKIYPRAPYELDFSQAEVSYVVNVGDPVWPLSAVQQLANSLNGARK